MACLGISVSRSRLFRRAVISDLLGWTKSATKSLSSSSRLLGSSSAGKMQVDLSGIYPPIVTPFNEDETIAYDKLQQNMDKWNKISFRGKYNHVYICSQGLAGFMTGLLKT